MQFNEWAAHFNVVLWATTESQSDLKGPPDLKKSNPNKQGTRALFRVVSLLSPWEKAFGTKNPGGPQQTTPVRGTAGQCPHIYIAGPGNRNEQKRGSHSLHIWAVSETSPQKVQDDRRRSGPSLRQALGPRICTLLLALTLTRTAPSDLP